VIFRGGDRGERRGVWVWVSKGSREIFVLRGQFNVFTWQLNESILVIR
jgi:hypothetical protein